jgi:hypothetical protein
MNLNHSFESCHVSQAVDGSLVLVNLGGQPGLAFKGFEMLADRERSDLIVTFLSGDVSDRPHRGPLLRRPDKDLPCLDLGKGFQAKAMNRWDIVDQHLRFVGQPPGRTRIGMARGLAIRSALAQKA